MIGWPIGPSNESPNFQLGTWQHVNSFEMKNTPDTMKSCGVSETPTTGLTSHEHSLLQSPETTQESDSSVFASAHVCEPKPACPRLARPMSRLRSWLRLLGLSVGLYLGLD